MLGFRGALRHQVPQLLHQPRTLRADRAQQDQPDQADDVAAEDEDETTPLLSVWEYIGSGYLNPGDVLLAVSVEASIRVAREALLDLRHGPPGGGGRE